MARVALIGGYYVAKSILAGAQRCLNLYPEANQEDAPFPYTDYLTPGLELLGQDIDAPVRLVYTASDSRLYAVIGSTVYYVDSSYTFFNLGSILTSSGPCYMADNRLAIVLVDGSSRGYSIDMATQTMAQIVADAFYGADRVDYLDTYFLFNRPATNQWYISLSNVTQAMMSGGPVVDGTVTAGGSGYVDGVHPLVPLTGGTGTGATASITVTAGVVTALSVVDAGDSYVSGDVLGAANTSLDATIATGLLTGAGSGYVDGAYASVPMVGGTGTGATANITIAGGVVTAVTLVSGGIDYAVTDVLSANNSDLGGSGAGFAWTVLTLTAAAGSGFAYTVGTVGSSAFDPLDIAACTTTPTNIKALVVVHREVWLLQARKAEIWYNAGAPDFTFARQPGAAVEHGCVAPYSAVQCDTSVIWLGRNKDGRTMVLQGQNYNAAEISTHAVEEAMQSYDLVEDAIGGTYQRDGHTFYVLTFPSADRTWVYDLAEKLWHEWCWTDNQGNEHRVRPNCFAVAYLRNIVGDWENGKLYSLDPTVYTDDGQPIVRRRGFPHLVKDGRQVVFSRFLAQMDVGSPPGLTVAEAPRVSLQYSNTKGASWGNPVTAPVGSTGQYDTSIQFQQLGIGRDRVFELFWDFPYKTALGGAWIEAQPTGR